ncbi:MAG: ATP-dependent DNA helicase RecG [Bacteroidetes bacterium HGW-Bacteroidetes-11]|nr:MAG: ATP-dependent DNA helicase RecG [Bacteroidetes bacterium HGW-Bacteroidetes-11]
MTQHILDTPIEYLKGIGPSRAELLRKETEVGTFGEMLHYYPFRYIDRSKFYTIVEIDSDTAWLQIKGKVTAMQTIGTGRTSRLVLTFRDSTGTIELIWFQGAKWVKEKVQVGKEYIIFGKPNLFNGRFNFTHPDIEPADEEALIQNEPLQPHYPTSEKLKSRGFTPRNFVRIMRTLIAQVHKYIPETLSPELIKSAKLMPRAQALINIHFPENIHSLSKAQERIKFDELFFIQLQLLRLKFVRMEKVRSRVFAHIGDYFNNFYSINLPFELTGAQKKVIKEIRADLGSGKQMNRLLQGDVGSGKTLVALMSMLIALDNGCQACLMAPTEILANQHYKTIVKMLHGLPIEIALLTGSTRKAARTELHSKLQDGRLQILVGTHALIEQQVQFQNLGLVVIDEQHRFGVAQRARLWEKSVVPPHILVMTATPIPRTLAMTLYGDLDISVIDELPPGRKPVKTYHFYEKDRIKVFRFMKDQISQGRQVYMVYPLINESDKLELQALKEGIDIVMRDFPIPQYHISIVHGQLKSGEKESEMKRFVEKKTQIMVATTVIEVGVDVPNASVMVIENAERFGLSQLHQLRGRVGRGADQSHCILMSSYKLTADGRKRLDTMVSTTDGFEIAEVDLHLRGPGDLQGTQQSGLVGLKLASLVKDEKILKLAREFAHRTLDEDPRLEKPENQTMVKHLQRSEFDWGKIS